jgi:probable rRNA maturation factor
VSRPAPAEVGATSIADGGHGIEVVIEDDRWGNHPDVMLAVEQAIAALLSSAAPRISRLRAATVLLDNDAHVAALNKNFRGKPQPTNVLSFPSASGPSASAAGAYAGDVIIARETLEREAQEMGVPLVHHLQHLVIHGLLHLAGYDHIVDRDALEMEALETRILATLGVADPYAD